MSEKSGFSSSGHGPKQNTGDEDQVMSRQDDAIKTMLAGGLAHLRDIKQMEMKWIDRYTVLILPAIVAVIYWNASGSGNSTDKTGSLIFIGAFVCMALTMSFQWVLLIERNSYYRVLRMVKRAQHHLGVPDGEDGFMADWMVNSAFPEGYGPERVRKIDGTQRGKTFTIRNIYTCALLCGYLLASGISFRGKEHLACCYGLSALALAIGDILFLALWIYPQDRHQLRKGIEDEKNLFGHDSKWYPENTRTGKP